MASQVSPKSKASTLTLKQGCPQHQFNFFFLKVPKCGSGTTMNIFLRMIYKYNQNTILYKMYLKKKYQLQHEFDIIPPPENQSYNNYVDHYDIRKHQKKDFSDISDLLPTGTVFIAIVRSPFRRFLSWLAFRKFAVYNTLERRAKKFANYTGLFPVLRAHPELLNNSVELAPNRIMKYFGYINSFDVDTFIGSIFRKFDFIILAEYFDESIILLKRRMCWRLEDVIYSKAHVVLYSKELKALGDNEEFRSWFESRNYADMRLYNETVSRFKNDLKSQEQDFFQEVDHFRKILLLVHDFCESSKISHINIEPSAWNANFTITTKDCVLSKTDPGVLKKHTAMWMYTKLQF